MNQFLQQTLVPLLIFVVFFFTLVVVSARSFIPDDLAQPAPIEPDSALLQLDLAPTNPDLNPSS